MNKALYLTLVFLIPVFVVLFSIDLFQDMWLYALLVVGYAAYIWFQPDQRMIKLIALTPVLALIVILVFLPIVVAIKVNVAHAVHFLAAVAVFAIPAAIVVGGLHFAMAYGLYQLCKRWGFLPNA